MAQVFGGKRAAENSEAEESRQRNVHNLGLLLRAIVGKSQKAEVHQRAVLPIISGRRLPGQSGRKSK